MIGSWGVAINADRVIKFDDDQRFKMHVRSRHKEDRRKREVRKQGRKREETRRQNLQTQIVMEGGNGTGQD